MVPFRKGCGLILMIFWLTSLTNVHSQNVIRGKVEDKDTGEPLIGATILIKDSEEGTVTDYDGSFELRTERSFPISLEISYTGFNPQEYTVSGPNERINLKLESSAITIEAIEVKGQRISDKQKAAPLTVESLDLLAIKETPSDNFYDGLGSLKGVDLTAASLGFKIINTRGFNSTSPVRSLQIIDGVDNQAPGLNFSLGNFLGSSELDVLRVDMIQGASSAFYGPNAFNGVISMETKNPFIHKGLSVQVKGGERNLFDAAIRWADAFQNKNGLDVFAYKFNLYYLRASDWEATNFNPVDGTESTSSNPGRWDAVNIYGDEYNSLYNFRDSINYFQPAKGLLQFHRTGYREIDLVDYDTRNQKANLTLHLRTNPAKTYESPELIFSTSFGSGTTVYQGDNRFSLRDILFFQNRLEFRKKDKFFIRAYATNEDAGKSYDPYFTALRMQEYAKSNELWQQDYYRYWTDSRGGRIPPTRYIDILPMYMPRMEGGFDTIYYPKAKIIDGTVIFDYELANKWFRLAQDSLVLWHQRAADFANQKSVLVSSSRDFPIPGTDRFQAVFDSITSLKNNEGGTRFFDKSALYHLAGEYTYNSDFLDRWVMGGSARLYRPYSEGTVFKDTAGTRISNFEFGLYTGIEKKFTRKWTINATIRIDKNENFPLLATPAASVVWSPDPLNYLRVSFSSAIRNPTLTDQYLNLNVGRATLLGNLEGFDSLLTVESFRAYLDNNFDRDQLNYFNAPPIEPEKVKTIEVGYRTTLFDRLYVDAGYYYSFYKDFIGYNLGIDTDFSVFGFPTQTKVYRIAANSTNEVTTQGFSIGVNFYFSRYYQIAGNYSWNKLNKAFPDDPIIPAFNTPEHKYNISLSARNMPLNLGFARLKSVGFNLNYKWIQGFQFEGSPQFTGNIVDYALMDAQINSYFQKIGTTLKIGASNILNNMAFQTYGGPRIGRLAYISLLYQWDKK